MNYRLNLRESRFQDALVTYVNVILECSVRGNYSLKDLVSGEQKKVSLDELKEILK